MKAASRSISTHRACPSFGRNSAYGKLVPIMSSVSQPMSMSSLGIVPSRPTAPVTNGRSSASTSLPRSALATPAPSRSATSSTSSAAPRAPCPMRIATFSPSFRISAACSMSRSCGSTRGRVYPTLE